MKTDADLLREYSTSASDAAFEELVRRYMNPVYRVCLRILQDKAAAEDASQATFIVFMRRASKLPNNTIISRWLLTTAAFTARDASKLRMRRQKHERAVRPDAGAAQAETELLREEISQYLDDALDTLPKPQRDCIELRFLCGRTEESVAQELCCPRSTVSARIAAGLDKLRERLNARGVTVPSVVMVAYLTDQGRPIAPEILPSIVTSIENGQHVPPDAITRLANSTDAALQKKTALNSLAIAALAALVVLIIGAVIVQKSRSGPTPQATPTSASTTVASVQRKAAAPTEGMAQPDQPETITAASLPVEAGQEAIQQIPAERKPVDLVKLPVNTWVKLDHTLIPPPGMDAADAGEWMALSQNKLVYDAASKRVLFYDRWVDKKHGGRLHYANCLFSFDPTTGELRAENISHWTTPEGAARTVGLPENVNTPTPCPRQVFHGFALAPAANSIFLCNGANGSAAISDKLVGHDLCQNTWRWDHTTKLWHELKSKAHPRNFPLGASIEYCAANDSLVYCNATDFWTMSLADEQWREAGVSVPTGGPGQTLAYDPIRRRMLIVGGSRADMSAAPTAKTENDPISRKLYAFDPVSETIKELAPSPTPLYLAHLTYDSKRDVFVTVNMMTTGRKPSGVFCYHPGTDSWSEIKTENALPPMAGWFGWLRMCYDSEHDCFIGLCHTAQNGDQLFAFRCVP